MRRGILYGIGVGPGDPEWITMKGVRLLGQCRHVCVPHSRLAAESVALDIARPYLRSDAVVHAMAFPMTAEELRLRDGWRQSARAVLAILESGEDCCFLTLGDALLYSTYVYLLRELRGLCPELEIVTVPGVTAFSAVAALTNFAVGQGKQLVTIVPALDDTEQLASALDRGGTVVLMKVGRRLPGVLELLASRNLLEQAVFVAHAGMPDQRVETDLRRLRGTPDTTGYLSTLIIHAGPEREEAS